MDLGLKSEVEKQKHKHECELPSSTVKTRERGSQGRRRAPRATPTGTRRRGAEEHRGAQSQGEGVCRSRLWDHAASGCCRGRSHQVALRPQLSLWMRFTRPSASRPHPAAGCSGSHLRRCSEELRGGGERSSLPAPALGPGPSCPWKLSPPCPHCRSPGDPAQGALSLAALSTPAVPGTTDGQRAGPQLDTSGRLLRCARRLNIHKHSPAGKEDSKPRKG